MLFRHGASIANLDAPREGSVRRVVPSPSRARLTGPGARAAQELTLDAASAARSSRSTTRPLDKNQIKKLLDSRNEREVLEGLRKVISVGTPSAAFPGFFVFFSCPLCPQ